MTLTCETSTNPTPYYSWSGVICDNGNSDSTCIYTPPIQDDGKRVTCEVTNPENSQVGSVSVEFNVSLWYRSRLSSFTMNGSDNGTLTVNESDNMTVKIQISAYGRPAPRVSVTKNGTEEMPTNDLWDMYKFSQVVTYTLSSAKCEDTGNYTGIIKNSYINSSAVELVVKCAPRLTRHVLSDVDKCPSTITERGFDLVVVANPLPSTDNVAVKYLGGTLDRNISSLFKVKQRPISLCETRLEVRVTDFTGLPDGKGKQGKPGVKHNEGSVNLPIMEYGNGADHDSESGIVASGGSNSPTEIAHMKSDSKQAPRQSDGAGYPAIGDCSLPAQHSGEFRKKSGRAAAYEVTSITSTGKVNIKTAAPQPNAYQDPWDIKKGDMTLAGAPGGPPTLHNLGPKGDEYAMVSNPKNKTTITAGPQGANHGKGDNTQGSPAKAQGQEDAAASQGPPLSMTPHPLDTPGYATLAQMAPAQGNQGDVTSSSGDAAASGSPVKNTSSSGDGTDNYDDIQRDGHDPKSMSQGPDEQYSHIGNY
ncbi:hypothetical protein BaRGS_00030421 [Batillaria attramentaria]|uniref:Ig-like domain-containing protein n=1 Tax=Batillaria attramentaria TaxID=370345 RepID=A0ABD0JTP0_9CAEN